jgi:hypothetical protein
MSYKLKINESTGFCCPYVPDASEWDDFVYDALIEVFEEIEMNELVEKVAIEMAMGNNGGDWAKHYNEDQKNVWRERAKEIIEMVGDYLLNGEVKDEKN